MALVRKKRSAGPVGAFHFARETKLIKNLLKRIVRNTGHRVRAKTPLASTPSHEGKKFLFIGGLHRSGTSILHRLLREHPVTTGFENTWKPEDEGQHLQSVFLPAHRHGGPGSFAFDFRAHLTEASLLNTTANREKLLREWGAYYDLSKNVLLEKSPPNLVRARFFQAMFPGSCFVFIVRHPVSVALATRKWTDASIIEILFHWHVAHTLMLADLEYLNNFLVMRYEDFVQAPQPYLNRLCDLVGIDPFIPQEPIVDHNDKYFAEWEEQYHDDVRIIDQVFDQATSPQKIFGYSLRSPKVGDCRYSMPD